MITARRYALLDPTAIGALLELQSGREVVTYDTPAASIARHVRADIGFATGQHAFAVAFWLSDFNEEWANTVSVGIATADAPLTTYVGGDAESIGYRLAAGQIHTSGASVATVPVAQPRQRVTVEVDLDASPQTVRWLVDGLEIASEDLPAGETWYPAVTVSGTEAYGVSAIFNGGRRVGEIASEYVWAELLPSIGNLDIAPVLLDYRSAAADTPPNAAFIGDITNAADVGLHSAITFWPLGSDRAGLRSTTLRLQNREGRYNSLLAFDARGAQVQLYDGEHGATFSAQRLVATLIVDSVRAVAGRIIELALASPLRALESPWQRRLLPPWVDEAVANRPWPVAVGAVRNVPPLYIGRDANSGEPQYLLHDGPIAVSQVRDGGDPLEVGVDPATYVLIDGGVQLYEDPFKLLTVDASGAAEIELPPGPTDDLGGIGEFPTETAGIPDGWEADGSGTGAQVTRAGAGPYAIRVETGTDSLSWQSAATITPLLDASVRYRIEWDVIAQSTNASPGAGQFPFYTLQITSSDGVVTYRNWPMSGVGAYSMTLELPSIIVGMVDIRILVQNTNISGLNRFVEIANLYAYVLPDPPAISADSLEGVGLAEYIRQVLQRLPDTAPVVIADAEAIDAVTGYQTGAWLYDAGSTLDVLTRVARAFTAGFTTDENGHIRVSRLVAPETVADEDLDFIIANDQTTRRDEPLPELLQLPGLTTSYGIRHNWAVMSPGDFVADVDPSTGVPLSVRTQFQRRSQRIIQAAGSLAGTYIAADRGDVIDTAHEDSALAQLEVDRLIEYASRPRWLVKKWRFAFPGAVPLLRAGMVGKITYPLHGFATGRNVQIVECVLYPWRGIVELSVIY